MIDVVNMGEKNHCLPVIENNCSIWLIGHWIQCPVQRPGLALRGMANEKNEKDATSLGFMRLQKTETMILEVYRNSLMYQIVILITYYVIITWCFLLTRRYYSPSPKEKNIFLKQRQLLWFYSERLSVPSASCGSSQAVALSVPSKGGEPSDQAFTSVSIHKSYKFWWLHPTSCSIHSNSFKYFLLMRAASYPIGICCLVLGV